MLTRNRIGVVVITRDRKQQLLNTLAQLAALPEEPPIVLVDNGSGDGTAAAVRRAFPSVDVVELAENRGAAARTIGVERLGTPYVAFSDDDSWWAPGALVEAADVLDAHPALGLLAARVLVGAEQRIDPVTVAMEASPLPDEEDLPGPPVLGFLACGAVVRRQAYLDVGGFHELLFLVGEERLLAVDLAAAGWRLAYQPSVVAHHHPASGRKGHDRHWLAVRNRLLFSLMRRPVRAVARDFAAVLRAGTADPIARRAGLAALARAPAALLARAVLPPEVEQRLQLVDDREDIRRAGSDQAGRAGVELSRPDRSVQW